LPPPAGLLRRLQAERLGLLLLIAVIVRVLQR